MITKGIIIDKIVSEENSNKYLVRIPFLETPANKSTIAKKDTYYEATVSEEPSLHQSYKKDDVVYVGFEDHLTDKPIIIGKLSLKTNSLDPRAYNNLQALEVSTSAVLPKNTSIGEVDGDRFLNAVRTAENLDYGVKDLNSLEIQIKDMYIHYIYDNHNSFTPALVIKTYPISKSVIKLVKTTRRVRVRLKGFKRSTKNFGFIRTLHPNKRFPHVVISENYLDINTITIRKKHLRTDESGNCYIFLTLNLSDYYIHASQRYMEEKYDEHYTYLERFRTRDFKHATDYLGSRWFSAEISNQSYFDLDEDHFVKDEGSLDSANYYYWRPTFNAVGCGDDRNGDHVHNYGTNCRQLVALYDAWKENGPDYSNDRNTPIIYFNKDILRGALSLNYLKKSRYYITHFTSEGTDSYSNILGNHMFREEIYPANRPKVIQILTNGFPVKGQNIAYSWRNSLTISSGYVTQIRPNAQREIFGLDFAILKADYLTTFNNMWLHESKDSGYLYCAKFYTYAVRNDQNTGYNYEYFIRSWLQERH